MSKRLQLRGGTTTQHTSFTGANREVTVDTDKDTLVVHDGSTAGGFPLAKQSDVDTKQSATADYDVGDNVKIKMGASDDLQIYHDGSDSYIDDSGAGNLILRGSASIELRKAGGTEKMLYAEPDAQVALYYDNASKLATTSSGVNVTGTITADGLDMGDSQKILLGNSADLQIYHDGSDSYIRDDGTGQLNIEGNDIIRLRQVGGSETYATFVRNGAATLYNDNSQKLSTTSSGVDVTGTITADGLDMEDNQKILLGNSDDLQIEHNGTDSYIQDLGTGDMNIRTNGNGILLGTTTGESMLFAQKDQGVKLFHNNAQKLLTESDGISVTGRVIADELDMGDNDRIKLGDSDDLQIYHDGAHSNIWENGTGNLRIRADNLRLSTASDAHRYLEGINGGAVNVYHNGSTKLATTSGGISVTGDVYGSSGNIGYDNGNRVMFTNNTRIDFEINGGTKVRIESDGDIHADGDVVAYSTTISDERLKENIQPIEDALSKVNQLNGCTFTYTADGKESAGLIAQEVEKVLPSAVSEKELPLKTDDGKAYKVLQYDQTIGLLVEAIKELTAKVEALEGS